MSHTLLTGKLGGWNPDFSGYHRVRFTTKTELGNPIGPKRVRLFDVVSGRFLQEKWSDNAGNVAFDYLAYRPNGYCALACNNRADATTFDGPSCADFVTPEPMP